MTTEPNRLPTEIAHTLCLDLVGYSQQAMEEQPRLVRELSLLVRSTPEFQRVSNDGDLLTLDRGDGMALVFFRDPISPVQCAVEIAQAGHTHPDLKLRMGINSGPVSRVRDINGKENVSGGGINMAQRVMDCGDANHILLSKTSAEVIYQFASWCHYLHDLGVYEVKHGVVLHLFNLCLDQVGNASIPQKLCVQSKPGHVTRVALSSQSPKSASGSSQVALIYKRNAPHINHLLPLLESRLQAEGYSLFIDRDMPVGVEWAQEIKRQVSSSYAVIPLLSAESIWSEMVEDEIVTAHEAAQRQNGRPRLLPVRVCYDGLLPDSIAHILDNLQYTLWQGPDNDEQLVADLIKTLRNPPQTRKILPREKLEPVGGAVPLDSTFYIVRPTDEEFATAIRRRDSIVLVKGARQMGKTSLLARGLQLARESGARCFRIDFQKMTLSHLQTEETFFLALAEMVCDQLDLDVTPDAVWSPRRLATVNFERYLRREVLQKSETPIVWALDEVDKLFGTAYGGDVFALFRSWHNDRALDPTGPWANLTLAIAYATEAHLFITDLNQSPFNVGTRLSLDDFTAEQVGELNYRYGCPLRDAEEVRQFHALVGGQPYLVRRGLDKMAADSVDFSDLEAQAHLDEGVFGDHLRRLLVSLSQDEALTDVVRNMLRGQSLLTAASFYRLRSGGLLAGMSEHEYYMRCQLYTKYLERHLL